MQTTPMAMDVIETTTTANFAVRALPAPSSFDTLTLLTSIVSSYNYLYLLTEKTGENTRKWNRDSEW